VREIFPHLITILDFLGGELDRLRLAAIRDAYRAGMTLGEIAGPLGQSGRQAAKEEMTRLEAAVNQRPRDARAWRKECSGQNVPATPGKRPRTEEAVPSWPAPVVELARTLLAMSDLLPDEVADEIEDVVLRLPGGEYASPRRLPAAVSLLVRALGHCSDLEPRVRQVVDVAPAILNQVDGPA
jgi:hypothetical protein